MSKETILSAINTQINQAASADSITPAIVGAILNDIVNEPTLKGYKAFSAKFTQVGTNPPTMVVLQNDFGVEFTVTRESIGSYRLTCQANVLPVLKFACPLDYSRFSNAVNGYFYWLMVYSSNINSVDIQTRADDLNTLLDGVLNNKFIEFRIYN